MKGIQMNSFLLTLPGANEKIMKKDFDKLSGKTKKEILEIIKDDQFNDPHSDEWIFYLEKDYFWRKKYLCIFFEEGTVMLSSIIVKNFWEKRY